MEEGREKWQLAALQQKIKGGDYPIELDLSLSLIPLQGSQPNEASGLSLPVLPSLIHLQWCPLNSVHASFRQRLFFLNPWDQELAQVTAAPASLPISSPPTNGLRVGEN